MLEINNKIFMKLANDTKYEYKPVNETKVKQTVNSSICKFLEDDD